VSTIAFIHGLALFAMGGSVAVYPKDGSGLRLARHAWMLAVSGLALGVHVWIEAGVLPSPGPLSELIEPAAYSFLVLFAAFRMGDRPTVLRLVPGVLFVAWVVAWVVTGAGPAQASRLATSMLGVPAFLFAGVAIAAGVPRFRHMGNRQIVPTMMTLALASVGYGALLTVQVLEIPLPGASALTLDLLLAGFALTLLAAVLQLLPIFRWGWTRSYKMSEERYRKLVEMAPLAIGMAADERILFLNPAGIRMLGGTSLADFADRSIWDLVHPGFTGISSDDVLGGAFQEPVEGRLVRLDGEPLDVLLAAAPLSYDVPGAAIAVFSDITSRKATERELAMHREHLEELVEERTRELKSALTTVKNLSGLLPICAWCKKIRDDTGYWNRLETYLADHTDVELTHSVCPDCLTKVRAEWESRSRGPGAE